MLTDIKGHLVDKSKIIYVSPVGCFRHWSMREVGAYFTIKLITGDTITVDESDFAEDESFVAWKVLTKKMTPMYEDLRKEREKLL